MGRTNRVRKDPMRRSQVVQLALILGCAMLFPAILAAHCDTMNGPVVTAAKAALEKGDLTPVLIWIKAEHEAETREAFARTLEVRTAGGATKELADRYFFETVVRLHRMGEGAPYTGLKPAGEPEPVVAMADGSIEMASVEKLSGAFARHLQKEIAARHAHVIELHRHAGENVEAGRSYVAAYVEYVHYLERVHAAMVGGGDPHAGADVHAH